MQRPPSVTIRQLVWQDVCTFCAGSVREGGGLLIGHRTKRGVIITASVALTHRRASKNRVDYDYDEVHNAKLAAYDRYKPDECLGAFHLHPWRVCTAEALLPQISEDDENEMLVGDYELIVSTFAWPGYWPRRSEFSIQSQLVGLVCRAECWLKLKTKVTPCSLSIQYGR